MDFRFEKEEEVAENSVGETAEEAGNEKHEERSNLKDNSPHETKMSEMLVYQEVKIPEVTNFKEEREEKQVNLWLAKLDLKKVKAAGTFLDGCKIVLFGFTENQNVQLARLLQDKYIIINFT